jgi:hypothetical protein
VLTHITLISYQLCSYWHEFDQSDDMCALHGPYVANVR